MPGPEQLIRAGIALPVAVVRRTAGMARGLLPFGGDQQPSNEHDQPSNEQRATSNESPEVAVAVDEALSRDRDPVEEAALDDDDLTGHVEAEVEVVAESADPGAESIGPEIHVDDAD
ncbi:MAG TPA: hypothetical protein VD790_09680 [Thermoleophilaceae bacterium]|nr:hypothetical protein [Thermoleophilaceae bacterium]